MTRGNFILITNTANWMSTQFNGDMYPSCNGKFVYHMLESVETYNDLAAAILKFDEERFGYADMHGIDMAPKSISDNIDFSKDYFAIYNSDYLYITSKTHPMRNAPLSPKTKWSRLSSREKFKYGILDALSSLTLKTLNLTTTRKKLFTANIRQSPLQELKVVRIILSTMTSRQTLLSTTGYRRFLRSVTPSWRTCQKA